MSNNTRGNKPRQPGLRSGLPRAGRALLGFWAVVLLGVAGGVGTLAYLGPPPKPVVRPSIAVATATRPSTSRPAAPLALPRPIKGPHLAIVVSGLGYSAELTEIALKTLPSQVGFLVSPYIADLPELIERAHHAGHEVFLDLPVQGPAPDVTSIGPHGLGYGNGPAEDMAALQWNLERAPGVVGVSVADPAPPAVASAPGFASTPDFMPIARAIAAHGLMVLLNGEQKSGLSRDLRADTQLEMDADAETIDHDLSALADRAAHGEFVLTMTDTMTPVGLTRLAAWLSSLPERGIILAAPSAMSMPDLSTPDPSTNPA